MSGIKRASQKIDPADEARILELRKAPNCLGMNRIADQVGVSSATVYKALKKHGLDGAIGEAPAVEGEITDELDEGLTEAARDAVAAWGRFAREAKKLVQQVAALVPPPEATAKERTDTAKARASLMNAASKAMAVVVKSGDAAMKWRQLLRGRPTGHTKNEHVPAEPAMTPEEKAEMERIERLRKAQDAAQ